MGWRWHPPHGETGAGPQLTSQIRGGSLPGVWDTLRDTGEEHLGIAQGLACDGLGEEPSQGKGET